MPHSGLKKLVNRFDPVINEADGASLRAFQFGLQIDPQRMVDSCDDFLRSDRSILGRSPNII